MSVVFTPMLSRGFVSVNKWVEFFESVSSVVNTLFENLFQYKPQEMYERAAERMPYVLSSVPDQSKTREMYERAVESWPYGFECALNQNNTIVVERMSYALSSVPDCFNFQEMC